MVSKDVHNLVPVFFFLTSMPARHPLLTPLQPYLPPLFSAIPHQSLYLAANSY